MTNVLLAIDGSTYAKAIAEFVANQRWVLGTNFRLIHTLEPPRGTDVWPEPRIDDSELDEAKKLLQDTAARLEQSLPGMNISFELIHGFPKDEILMKAIDWPADMIIMGSHGRGGLQRFLLGSVSLAVMTHAPCSTLIVRIPKMPKGATKAHLEKMNAV